MTAVARLDLRLNENDKSRIARAASLRGLPVATFVRDAVLREADNVMAAELSVTLSPAESRRFLAALDKPFKPNARLKRAMERGVAGR
ncbi:MAG TPA: DUF1778 domain-containing protein [Rhodanobacteraceae bacterium]|nr:DUF1778 domain-containing protein [Rhodanobacteraceae bacterium]